MISKSPCSTSESGPYDRCLTCPFIGNGCSGPRTTAMGAHERYIHWMRALRDLRRQQGWPVSNVQIAEACGLGKNTVDNFFAEKNKDVSRVTAGRIEDYLVGGDAKWPCAMDINKDKDVIYQDRPETLEALARRNKEVEDIHASYKAELDSVRAEAQQKIEHLLRDIELLREDAQKKIDFLKAENAHKAKVIERLLK